MGREKGCKKTGGRKKGTPNKKKEDVKIWVADIIGDNKAEFEKRLHLLPDADFVKVYVQLLNYVIPKQSAVSPDDLIKKEREMLQDLVLTQDEQTLKYIATRLYELNKKIG